MSTYLLLRDNKESGPYSLDDLHIKGLKGYDLVWIEGKSAAWRYPSEIEELKSFAPVVEEQPFDRFFKKPVQANTSVTVPPRAAAERENSFSSGINNPKIGEPSTSMIGDPSTIPGKRIIYVTLPAAKASPAMRDSSYRSPVKAQPVLPTQEIMAPLAVPGPARTEHPTSYAHIPGHVEEKFSQDPEDMWKTSVELAPRQKGPGLKRILQPLAVIVSILALLAAGIFIGLSIKSDAFGFSQKTESKDPAPSTVLVPQPRVEHSLSGAVPVVQTTSAVPVNQQPNADSHPDNTIAMPPAATIPPTDNHGGSSITPAPAGNTGSSLAPVQKKRSDKAKDRSFLTARKAAASVLPASDSATMGLPAVHRESIHRDDPAMDKDVIKNNISNMVSVGAGKYAVGTFGGISDIQLTVSNHSIYPIDLVVVEVQYIQANKKVYKTENINFRDVAPGAALMQIAPKSPRGVKIQYKITLINSKELGLAYSGT